MQDFHLWDVIVAWRDHVFKADFYQCSREAYLSSMRKLINGGIIDIKLPLLHVDDIWLETCKEMVDKKIEWAQATKKVRKSCLNTFYAFLSQTFNTSTTPYRRHPCQPEIEYLLSPHSEGTEKYASLESTMLKHALSSTQDKTRAQDLCPLVLCTAISKINERDAYIVWLMLWTKQPLEAILNLRNTAEDYSPPYIRFKGIGEYIPTHITKAIDHFRISESLFIFSTTSGKQIQRNQVTRNIKKAGHALDLDYELTPKIINGLACAYMSRDKRSDLERAMQL